MADAPTATTSAPVDPNAVVPPGYTSDPATAPKGVDPSTGAATVEEGDAADKDEAGSASAEDSDRSFFAAATDWKVIPGLSTKFTLGAGPFNGSTTYTESVIMESTSHDLVSANPPIQPGVRLGPSFEFVPGFAKGIWSIGVTPSGYLWTDSSKIRATLPSQGGAAAPATDEDLTMPMYHAGAGVQFDPANIHLFNDSLIVGPSFGVDVGGVKFGNDHFLSAYPDGFGDWTDAKSPWEITWTAGLRLGALRLAYQHRSWHDSQNMNQLVSAGDEDAAINENFDTGGANVILGDDADINIPGRMDLGAPGRLVLEIDVGQLISRAIQKKPKDDGI